MCPPFIFRLFFFFSFTVFHSFFFFFSFSFLFSQFFVSILNSSQCAHFICHLHHPYISFSIFAFRSIAWVHFSHMRNSYYRRRKRRRRQQQPKKKNGKRATNISWLNGVVIQRFSVRAFGFRTYMNSMMH